MSWYEAAAILGALAWIPYLVKLIKDLTTIPEVRIIVEHTAEIGYTSLGPILNLRIAFAVRHRDIVVSSIKIRLKHEGGEEKSLSWRGITQRIAQMQVPESVPIPWEKESSVLAIKLTEKEVEERLIRFQDNDFHMKKEESESIAGKKLAYLKGKNEFNPDLFLKSEEMNEIITFIKQWFNWKQGKYSVAFDMESPDKFVLKDNTYEFYLNPLNIESLELNKNLIILSYEDMFKFDIEDYKPHKPVWHWVNPVIKKV